MARSLLGQGTLSGARDRSDQSQAPLVAAIAMFREMGMPFWMARVQAVLARGSTLPTASRR